MAFDEDSILAQGGNNILLSSWFIDALKLQPCNPTFLDNRDATLLADQIAYDSENQ